MAEDGAAHDGQVRVGAYEVVGELLHEVQQLPEGCPVDLHGDVPAIKDDAVLVVVDIGGILEEPFAVVDGDGDDPVVPPGGMVHPARVALIFPAELALGVAALGGGLGGGDGPGVLLRLGEVDGDVQIAVLRGGNPLHVSGNAVAADVVRILAEPVIPVRGRLGRLGVFLPEGPDDLRGAGGENSHQAGVKEVPAGDVPLNHPPLYGKFRQQAQDHLQGGLRCSRGLRLLILRQTHGGKQGVDRPGSVSLRNQPPGYSIVCQGSDLDRIDIDHTLQLLSQ